MTWKSKCAHRVGSLSVGLILVCGCQSGSISAQTPPEALPALRGTLKHGLNIVFVGDSNTEIGMVTGALSKALEAKYGYYGSGWRALVDESGNGRPGAYNSNLVIKNEGNWKKSYMVPQGDKEGFLSPSGVALVGEDPAARTTVAFQGKFIEVYYLKRAGGGSFGASLNGGAVQVVATATAAETDLSQVERVVLEAPTRGSHTLVLQPTTGSVTLVGVNATSLPGTASPTAMVHKWGRGHAETRQFLSISPAVTASALRLIQPDVIVFMLGTNDHNINGVGTQTYLSNMEQLVTRARTMAPKARVVLLSTIPAGVWPSSKLGEGYARDLPLLAQSMGVAHLDLWNWAGGNSGATVERGLAPATDAIHWGEKGGTEVAARLLPVLEQLVSVSAKSTVPEVLQTLVGTTTPEKLAGQIPAGVLGHLGLWLAGDGPMDLDAQGRVVNWKNLLPASVHRVAVANQPISTWRPRWIKSGVNGLPVLDFDGKSSSMWLPQSAGLRAYTVVARARKPGGALMSEGRSYYRFFGSGSPTPNGFFAPEVAADIVKRNGAVTVNGANVDPNNLEYPLQNFAIITVDPGGHSSVRLLGHNQWHLRYAKEQTEINAFWDGEIAEIVLYSNIFDSDRRQAVEGYLGAKYGIALPPK